LSVWNLVLSVSCFNGTLCSTNVFVLAVPGFVHTDLNWPFNLKLELITSLRSFRLKSWEFLIIDFAFDNSPQAIVDSPNFWDHRLFSGTLFLLYYTKSLNVESSTRSKYR
jgi:hypothetical protein